MGRVPHALGDILLEGDKKDGQWRFLVTLPEGLTGSFELEGRVEKLVGGRNEVAR